MTRPNGPQFEGMLFHGSSDRYGLLKKGDTILPASKFGVPTNHDVLDYPDAPKFAHATYSRREAFHYANWAAKGVHEGAEEFGHANPVVYMVEGSKNQEEDPKNKETGVRSRHGFKVLGTYEDPNWMDLE